MRRGEGVNGRIKSDDDRRAEGKRSERRRSLG